jgi:hypothetical protein
LLPDLRESLAGRDLALRLGQGLIVLLLFAVLAGGLAMAFLAAGWCRAVFNSNRRFHTLQLYVKLTISDLRKTHAKWHPDGRKALPALFPRFVARIIQARRYRAE